MTQVTRDPIRGRKVKHLLGWGKFGAAQLVCFARTLLSNRILVHNGNIDVQ